ncbi:MAG: peptidoglycan binding domain-containing protein, partial [Anaerolineae bacterium]|nr:peptidoglycan binding domain-containing protein [Anaerolineae bacterium]
MTTRTVGVSQSAVASGRRRWLLVLLILLSLAALLIVALVAALEFAYADKIYPGVTVAGIPLGGKTRAQAEATLTEELDPFPIPAIVLRVEGEMIPLRPGDVGARLDVSATAAAAYRVGRGGDFWSDMRARLAALRTGYVVRPVVSYDERELRLLVERLAQRLYRPVREARLDIQGLEPVVIPGQPGREVDVEATLAAIVPRLQRGESGVVDVV